MQIFVTSPSPADSANRLWQQPNRARKMITETMQILACCQQSLFGGVTITKADGTPYKTPKSRMNHPVVIWARSSVQNTAWLLTHCYALYKRYSGKAFTNIMPNIKLLTEQLVQSGCSDLSFDNMQFCNFAKADDKGLDFRHIDDVHEAYNQFLLAQNA